LQNKQNIYEKSVATTEEIIIKSKEVRDDPTMAYELSLKETAEEKAKAALKILNDRETELQEYINQFNEHQKNCIESLDKLMSKTKTSISAYIFQMMNITLTDISKSSEHLEGITLLTEEKGKQFSKIKKLNFLENKKNILLIKLKDLRQSLEAKEVD